MKKCAELPCGIMTGSVDSVRFHTSSLLLFLSASTAPLFASVFFLPPFSFTKSSLCFRPACASLSFSLTHGSGFGSVTRWFQLQKVRISDRVSASPSTSPLSLLTEGNRTITAKNKHKGGIRLMIEE